MLYKKSVSMDICSLYNTHIHFDVWLTCLSGLQCNQYNGCHLYILRYKHTTCFYCGEKFVFYWWTSSTEAQRSLEEESDTLLRQGSVERRWSCRDSNPGPNKQSKRFLHAYPLVDCREITDERHTYYNLSLFISLVHQDLAKASSTFMMLRSGHR